MSDLTTAQASDLMSGRDGLTLRLRRHKSTVPLPTLVSDALREMLGVRRHGPLFTNTLGRPMDRAAVSRALDKLVLRSGIGRDISPETLTISMRDVAIKEGATFLELVHGLPVLSAAQLAKRAKSQQPPTQHVAFHMAALLSDDRNATESLLDQADTLANTKVVHAATRLMLAGAAFERHLRTLCLNAGLIPANYEADIAQYGGMLRGMKLITEAEVQMLPGIAGKRNDAAHGRFEKLSDDDADWMITSIRRFVARHPVP